MLQFHLPGFRSDSRKRRSFSRFNQSLCVEDIFCCWRWIHDGVNPICFQPCHCHEDAAVLGHPRGSVFSLFSSQRSSWYVHVKSEENNQNPLLLFDVLLVVLIPVCRLKQGLFCTNDLVRNVSCSWTGSWTGSSDDCWVSGVRKLYKKRKSEMM